jgi:hypothetical protein
VSHCLGRCATWREGSLAARVCVACVLRVCVVCVLRAPFLIARPGFAALSRTPSLAPPSNVDDDDDDNDDKDDDESVWARDDNDEYDNDDDDDDGVSPPLLVTRVQVARLADFGKMLPVSA